ncbi:hypothetical protein MMPV_008001 [Pyropia vietnamensis]
MRLSSIDLFRKVPRDLTHATTHGGVLSVLTFTVLGLLFFFETWSFLAGSTRTYTVLDDNAEEMLQVNFAIRFLELPCPFATVEAWDYFGTNRLDVTADVRKLRISGVHGEHEAPGEDAFTVLAGAPHVEPRIELGLPALHTMATPHPTLVSLTESNFEARLEGDPLAFVAFVVAWCSYCRSIAPTWSALAEKAASGAVPAAIYIVDCVQSEKLCAAQHVRSYPTLRLYYNGRPSADDYDGERSVKELSAYARQYAEFPDAVRAATIRVAKNQGCFISGTLWVHRVPGAFHVIAKSDAHTFDAANTNTSHIISHLSFGTPLSASVQHKVPRDVAAHIHPLDGRHFINYGYAQSHEHYIKVVSTHYRTGTLMATHDVLGYQQAVSSMTFDAAPAVPEARFSYDLSPTAVIMEPAGRRWYDWATNLVAILGGAFAVLGLLDGAVHRLEHNSRKGEQSPLSRASPTLKQLSPVAGSPVLSTPSSLTRRN